MGREDTSKFYASVETMNLGVLHTLNLNLLSGSRIKIKIKIKTGMVHGEVFIHDSPTVFYHKWRAGTRGACSSLGQRVGFLRRRNAQASNKPAQNAWQG
jgi:hypothetical protein